MQQAQPPDEWTFLRPDEFVDDDSVERADGQAEQAAEVGAMHVHHVETPVRDPGRADVDAGGNPDDRPVAYFEDEEPEMRGAPERDGDHEPDLEEILESQHYAFGSEES